MSFIREDDSPWLAALIVIGLIVAALLLWTRTPHAEGQSLTLKGRLTGTEDAAETGAFMLDADELGIITINVGEVSYLGDWFAGSSGHRVIMTIAPEP